MKKYILIGLSTISVSLTAMNKSENTWVLNPLGGYIVLHPYLKEELCQLYNTDESDLEKAIHFIPVDCGNTNHPVYQYLKNRMGRPVPFNLFTKGKSYTLTQNNITFTIVSDKIYDEKSFDTYANHWKKIHSNNQ